MPAGDHGTPQLGRHLVLYYRSRTGLNTLQAHCHGLSLLKPGNHGRGEGVVN
jgi:hypothetical protein